uniref:SH2 domain containing 7 n=1 Tax=Scophthalmus maximus TaxID=52904 RepID=A0A8D3AYH8_SCOMX
SDTFSYRHLSQISYKYSVTVHAGKRMLTLFTGCLEPNSHAEQTEGKLRELASKWFIETQVPLIVHNGFFPTWFLGFITRKDAEEILRLKEQGCFLVRLSKKAIGYILSYKGKDRFRHFVINQSEKGQFVVCGDCEAHDTMPDLIQYYKSSPIEPFGEYLTSSCFDLYDVIQINPNEKPVANVRAVNVLKQQTNSASEQQRTQPQKNLTNMACCVKQEVPPLPRRSRHVDSGHVPDQDGVVYAQLRKQTPWEIPRSQDHTVHSHLPGASPGWVEGSTAQHQTVSQCCPPGSVYYKLSLLESSKRRSLPLPDNSSDGEHYHKLSAPPHTPPRLSPTPIRQVPRMEKTDSCSSPGSRDHLGDSAVYHLAGKHGIPHTAPSGTSSGTLVKHSDSVYAEVPSEAPFSRLSRGNTYELIPGREDSVHLKPKSNTYELLEDVRPKSDKWKWLFPEAKRK